MLEHLFHRCRHACAPFIQRVSAHPQLVVLGFNSGANVGDIALTEAVGQFCARKGINVACQDLSHLSRWKRYDVPVVVAGGGVLHADVVAQLAARYRPDRVAFVGVDHWSTKALVEHRGWLREVAYFSSRSQRFSDLCQSLLERSDLRTHPDLVFGVEWGGVPAGKTADAIGINCLPLYRSWHRNDWRTWISETDPFFTKATSEISAYDKLVERLVDRARSSGRRLVHIPFAPEDHIYALDKIKCLGVDCLPYIPNVRRVASAVRSCAIMIGTRLHAKIFSYVLGVPCVSLNYSQKCIDLSKSLGFETSESKSQVEYEEHGEAFVRSIFDKPLGLDRKAQDEMRLAVHSALEDAINALNVHACDNC